MNRHTIGKICQSPLAGIDGPGHQLTSILIRIKILQSEHMTKLVHHDRQQIDPAEGSTGTVGNQAVALLLCKLCIIGRCRINKPPMPCGRNVKTYTLTCYLCKYIPLKIGDFERDLTKIDIPVGHQIGNRPSTYRFFSDW